MHTRAILSKIFHLHRDRTQRCKMVGLDAYCATEFGLKTIPCQQDISIGCSIQKLMDAFLRRHHMIPVRRPKTKYLCRTENKEVQKRKNYGYCEHEDGRKGWLPSQVVTPAIHGIDSHSCGRAASKEIAPGIDTEFVREIEALSFLIDCAYVCLFGMAFSACVFTTPVCMSKLNTRSSYVLSLSLIHI